jgi:hypothetical protein
MDDARESPRGLRRLVRGVMQVGRVAGQILQAYLEGNASVEGYVKVAQDLGRRGSPAPERSPDRIASLPVSSVEPLAVALRVAYGLGPVVHGQVSTDGVKLTFRSLGATPASAPADRGRREVLGVLALDASSRPLESPGSSGPDARTTYELTRALDALREAVDRPSFELHLALAGGAAAVRVAPEGTLLVVAEAGADLRALLARPLDRSMTGLARQDEGGAAALPGTTADHAAGERVTTGLPREEVESSLTQLLKAAEQYVGPRLLDWLVVQAAPVSWGWEQRRVRLRAAGEEATADEVQQHYREAAAVFAQGASVSQGLKGFDFDAWLDRTAAGFAPGHLEAARLALRPAT